MIDRKDFRTEDFFVTSAISVVTFLVPVELFEMIRVSFNSARTDATHKSELSHFQLFHHHHAPLLTTDS